MHWSHRAYGQLRDPVHKSHLLTIAGPYACPRRFVLDRLNPRDAEAVTPDKLGLGTATHEVIAAHLTTGIRYEENTTTQLEFELRHWLGDAAAAVDRDMLRERAEMVRGLLAHGLSRHVGRVIACESGFIAPFGPYWLCGHVDLVYEPLTAPLTIALADWKTGASKPHLLELAHGWEAGVYSAALRHGFFMERSGRTRDELERALIEHAEQFGVTPTYGTFPSAVHHVHLADYVPYRKTGSKRVHRPEDLLHYGYPSARQHTYKPTEMRGGAWISVPLREGDLTRFAWRLKQVVGAVRMGKLFDMPGEQCTRCRHQTPCLNDGYADMTPSAQTELWELYGKDVLGE